MKHALVIGAFLASSLAMAQQSASYRMEEHVFNAGGHPEGGVTLTSPGYRITLDSVGEGIGGRGLASLSYSLDGGFIVAYPPAGEVMNLHFGLDQVTLTWNPDASGGMYNVYRDQLGALPGLGYGQCSQQDIAAATTTDGTSPALGECFFYLVTAQNRLGEEGTKGFASTGAERGNPIPCP